MASSGVLSARLLRTRLPPWRTKLATCVHKIKSLPVCTRAARVARISTLGSSKQARSRCCL